MKRRQVLILGLMLASLAMGSTATAAGKAVTLVGATDTINGDYFAADSTVLVAGNVTGDVYVAGGTVTINGSVGGDVIATGGTVIVGGKVAGNVRAAGGTITISGEVGRSVTIAGGTLEVGKPALLHGNLIAAGSTITLSGPVTGSVRLAGGDITLGGEVGGEARVKADHLTIASTANLASSLAYSSQQIAQIEAGSKIAGPVDRRIVASKPRDNRALQAGYQLWMLMASLILGLVVAAVAPKPLRAAASTIGRRPWASLGWGLVILLAAPIAILLAAITLIGLPLAIASGLIWLLALILAPIVSSLWLGRILAHLAHWKISLILEFGLGSLALGAFYLLPIIGGIASLGAILIGLGAMVLAATGHRQETLS